MGKFNIEEIKELIKSLDESGITKFELNDQDYKINIEKEKIIEVNNIVEPLGSRVVYEQPVQTPRVEAAPAAAQVQPEATAVEEIADDVDTVVSPIVGTFYGSPSPDSEPFVKVGSDVKKGDVLCIVEAMKIMNEIKSDYDGIITEILLENEDIVEYGQPLMLIRSK